MNSKMSRDPWQENAEWVWDYRKNPRLSCIAVLEILLTSTQTNLTKVADNWLSQLHKTDENTWFWGGFSCDLISHTDSTMTLHLASSGQDTYETLVHASRWLYEEVVVPNEDVTVQWRELPLQKSPKYRG